MNPKETKIINIWQKTSDDLNGVFSITYQQVNGGMRDGGLYLVNIEKEYSSLRVQIHTTFSEFGLQKDEYENCNITITATKKTKRDIELSLWRKDYMDKIFLFGKSSTGWKEFDKIIGIKASRNARKYVPKIFENEELRKELIEDKYRAYHIKTVDDILTMQRKSSLKMEDPKMIISEYNRFIRFVDGLINARIF